MNEGIDPWIMKGKAETAEITPQPKAAMTNASLMFEFVAASEKQPERITGRRGGEGGEQQGGQVALAPVQQRADDRRNQRSGGHQQQGSHDMGDGARIHDRISA